MSEQTPHDRLYELASKKVENDWASVVKLSDGFGIHTEAGHVEVYSGEIARLNGLFLRWGCGRSRALYLKCLDQYINSLFPPSPKTSLVIRQEVCRPSRWRQWARLVLRCFWPFRR